MGFNDFDESRDGGMRQLSEDVYLSFQIFDLVGLVHPLLLVDLNSYLLVGSFVEAHSDSSVGSLAQLSKNLIVVHLCFGFDGHDEVQQLTAALDRLLLLRGVLHLLHLQLADVVGRELILHQVAHELDVHLLGPLLLFFQRLLRTFGV